MEVNFYKKTSNGTEPSYSTRFSKLQGEKQPHPNFSN